MRIIPKPDDGEFAPYALMYIGLLPDDGRVLDHMRANLDSTVKLIRAQPELRLTEPCAPGEWTIKEIVAHISDDERIYAYRALRFARNDPTELPGFDQELYTQYSGANNRSIDDLLEEFRVVRLATLALFDSLDDPALLRSGIANGHIMSVRAAAYHIAGHELHHINSIRENYLRG
jgi:uncharacterized damage-inducible protein DinB